MKGEKRHEIIRRFVIEMHKALKKQEKGECVIVFTDETYHGTSTKTTLH